MIATRSALLPDVPQIHAIITPYAEFGVLLPRNIAEISENVRDFVVVEEDSQIIDCGALHLYGRHLAEIRSIAVSQEHKGRGAGRALVETLLAESRRHNVTCVCLFTRTPDFFAHIAFRWLVVKNYRTKFTRTVPTAQSSHVAMRPRWLSARFRRIPMAFATR